MRPLVLSLLLFGLLSWQALFCEESAVVLETVTAQPYYKEVTSLDWKGWTTIVVFALTIGAMIAELKPPDVTMLLSSGALVVLGILPPSQFLAGFSNDIIMTIAMLCIIVRAIEIHGILDLVGKKILSGSKSVGRQLASLMLPVSAASAFLNNTPIVLLMTPLVRRWALKNSASPSKFLIPLSYAAILGGMCTIIGTSTNLVIEGLLRNETPSASLGFFELSFIGIPCVVVGTAYMLVAGRRLLPDRIDPLSAAVKAARDYTAEFLVTEDCPLSNRKIEEVSGRYFRGELVVRIERGNLTIDSPGKDLVILAGDRLVFAGDIHHIAELHAVAGLQSLADPHFELDVSSSHFSEIVISTTSIMIGKTLRNLHFRTVYGASVLAIYREGERVADNVADIPLQAGDTLMLLSSEQWHGGDAYTKDFYCIRNSEKLNVFQPLPAFTVFAALIAMITAATIGVPIMICSMATVAFLLFTKNINVRQAQSSIVWNVLLLIACSFALAKAMVLTGVAGYFAQMILTIVGTDPYLLLGGILFVAIISTELLSNNAAALILFPIALQAAQLAGFTSPESAKTIGVTIAVGCSCGFALPTGYQTHMIVFGEGGYRFTDFFAVGVLMDILIWIVAMAIIPLIWPLI